MASSRDHMMFLLPIFAAIFVAVAASSAASQSVSVTTYHYDNYRTGWNANETTLTPANVNSTDFGLLYSVALDDQVDAQPLYMPGVNITAGQYQGLHNVIYVATEGDTVFAIDAQAGTILLSTSLGTPIQWPLGCNNNGPNVGINSTPVIDPTSNTLYVMVYTQSSGSPEYMLHALDLGSLSDTVTPQLVSASHLLNSGTLFEFNATYQRQRPGLLLANGNIYAGFGSFCDFAANLSRGWLLGWQTGTLTPLAANDLFDVQGTNHFFLSSIWMSGYAPSTDDSGNVLVVTGNSDPSGTTYDGVTDIQESVIKISPDLSTIIDLFTPSDWSSLDKGDRDFGSGGVMVMPDQPGFYPHLAVAAGKDGNMYFMNEDNLGGYSSSANNVLGTYSIGGCWCGPSYYVDPSDSIPRVVSSGGSKVQVYQVLTSSSSPSLNPVSHSGVPSPGSGFFTSISSNGTSNAIIWALSRPRSASAGNLDLYAFNPDSGSTLRPIYNEPAGYWQYVTGNSNLVPVVANGEVFVASYQELNIFGLTKYFTQTTLSSSASPANYGQSVTLAALVSSNGNVTPTGTVTFWNGSSKLGTATLSAGTAALVTTELPLGTSFVTAEYNGDSSNSKSQSSVLPQQVVPATISLTVTSRPNPSEAGKLVKFTATLSSNGGLPKGQPVIFGYQGSQIGTANVTADGTATFSTNTLPGGTDTVTATYAGSADYSADSGTVEQTVLTNTTTGVSSGLNPSTYGQAVTFTATVGLGARPVISGTVQFVIDGSNFGSPVSLNGSGQASVSTATLSVSGSPHTVTANYSGSGEYQPSSGSLGGGQTVNQGTTSINVTSVNPSSELYGQDALVTITAVLSWAGSGTAPTAANVTIGGNGNGAYGATSCSSPSGDTITCTSTYTPNSNDTVGTYTEAGTFSADANYSGSTSPQSGNFQITQAGSGAISLGSSQNPSTYGQSVTFTATIPGQYGQIKRAKGKAGPQIVTGTVTWSANTGCGTTPVTSGTPGTATCTTSILSAGSDTVTANYSGDGNHNPGSGSTSQSVSETGTTINVTSVSPASENYGSTAAVTITAVLSWTGSGTAPTASNVTIAGSGLSGSFGTTSCGTATGNTITCTNTYSPNGTDAVGSYTMSAAFSGDSNYTASSSPQTNNFTINAASTTTSVTLTSGTPPRGL